MEHIICPACGHDHGRAWRHPQGGCGIPMQAEDGSRIPCGCEASLHDAILAGLVRATYVLAATAYLRNDTNAGIMSVTTIANALRAVMEGRS